MSYGCKGVITRQTCFQRAERRSVRAGEEIKGNEEEGEYKKRRRGNKSQEEGGTRRRQVEIRGNKERREIIRGEEKREGNNWRRRVEERK